MAIYGDPQPKAKIGSIFRKQLEKLAEHADEEKKAILNQENPKWYRPVDWEDKSIFDIPSYHPPFLRTEQEEDFIKATTNPKSPGSTGDLTMVSIQGDFLHVFERAFRSRNMSACRTRIQPGGRKYGHEDDNGVIKKGLLGYIVNVDKLNKGETV